QAHRRPLEDQDLRQDEDRPLEPPLQGDQRGEGIFERRALRAQQGRTPRNDHHGLTRREGLERAGRAGVCRKADEEGQEAVQDARKADDRGGQGKPPPREGPDEVEVVEHAGGAHHVDERALLAEFGDVFLRLLRKVDRIEEAAKEPPRDGAEAGRDGARVGAEGGHAGATYSLTLSSRYGKLIGFSKTPSTLAPHASSCPSPSSMAPEMT